MSVVALAIDAILPALDIIGLAVGTEKLADNQLLITMIFLGLGIGPLIFGPVSDSVGRKPVVYVGFLIFIIASFMCVHTSNLTVMIAGRILQGIGLSAPRTIAIKRYVQWRLYGANYVVCNCDLFNSSHLSACFG